MRQKLAPRRRDRSFHSRPRRWIDEQSDASAPSCPANFAGQRTLTSRSGNDAVNHRRGNRGQITPAKLPFLADELAGFLPVVSIESNKEPPRYVRNAREITKDSLVAPNVPLENFPVVDAGLPGLPGVAKDEAPLELVEIASDLFAPFASGLQMNRAGAAKGGRIMILRSRGYANDDGFCVTADVDPIFQAQSRAREPIQRRADGHGHGA